MIGRKPITQGERGLALEVEDADDRVRAARRVAVVVILSHTTVGRHRRQRRSVELGHDLRLLGSRRERGALALSAGDGTLDVELTRLVPDQDLVIGDRVHRADRVVTDAELLGSLRRRQEHAAAVHLELVAVVARELDVPVRGARRTRVSAAGTRARRAAGNRGTTRTATTGRTAGGRAGSATAADRTRGGRGTTPATVTTSRSRGTGRRGRSTALTRGVDARTLVADARLAVRIRRAGQTVLVQDAAREGSQTSENSSDEPVTNRPSHWKPHTQSETEKSKFLGPDYPCGTPSLRAHYR